jgi:hypothetical protein
MEIIIPINQDFSLRLTDLPDNRNNYSTSRLQKGLVLYYRGQDLAEEAVGFGLPVLKCGLQTFFPGNVDFDLLHMDSVWQVTAKYTIDLEEKILRPNGANLDNSLLYTIKNYLAALIRRLPITRQSLTGFSSGLRRFFGWETTYQQSDFSAKLAMTYEYNQQTNLLTIEADLSTLPQGSVTEIIIMNEQGARFFDQYHDSDGIGLSGKEIGYWDAVTAETASFESSSHHLSFTVNQVPGARLFRGRELIDTRLAWAGFGYSIQPPARIFNHSIRIERIS